MIVAFSDVRSLIHETQDSECGIGVVVSMGYKPNAVEDSKLIQDVVRSLGADGVFNPRAGGEPYCDYFKNVGAHCGRCCRPKFLQSNDSTSSKTCNVQGVKTIETCMSCQANKPRQRALEIQSWTP